MFSMKMGKKKQCHEIDGSVNECPDSSLVYFDSPFLKTV